MDQPPPGEPHPDKDWSEAVSEAATHVRGKVASAQERAAAHDRRLPILLAGFVVFLSVAAWNAYRLATPPVAQGRSTSLSEGGKTHSRGRAGRVTAR